MSIEIIHNFLKLLMNFDFFIVGDGFAGFGLDKDDGFNRILLDSIISLPIKEFKLLFGFFLE